MPAMQETWIQSLDYKDSMEKWMATHSSVLAWRTPWEEEPGGLQSMGDWYSKSIRLFETNTSLSFRVFYKMIKRSSWIDEHTIVHIFITPRLTLMKIAKLSFFFLFKEVYTCAGTLTRQPSRNPNTDSHKTVLSSLFLFNEDSHIFIALGVKKIDLDCESIITLMCDICQETFPEFQMS